MIYDFTIFDEPKITVLYEILRKKKIYFGYKNKFVQFESVERKSRQSDVKITNCQFGSRISNFICSRAEEIKKKSFERL